MKRIEPGEVVEAYRKTGFSPSPYGLGENGKSDPFGVMFYLKTCRSENDFDSGDDLRYAVVLWCEQTYGRDYYDGYTVGFTDDHQLYPRGEEIGARHKQGYADGIAARKAVIEQLGAEL